MNTHFLLPLAALIGGLILTPSSALAQLKVVTATPDLGSIAEMIGGDRVTVTSLARGTEDAHFVPARPSFIPILNGADLLIDGGADLEAAWLPPLVNIARNREILPGRRGHLAMARHIDLMDVATGPVDRSQGDVHAAGNPHFMLDPENGRIAARMMAERFSELDPEHATHFAENLARFSSRLDEGMQTWTRQLAPFEGARVVAYHKNYDYLARRFGFRIVGEIEPLPGIEPSPRQITRLISSMKDQDISMIWMEPFRPRRTPERIAEEAGVRLVLLPEQVGAVEGTEDYIALIDYNVRQIVAGMARE
jgi:zinc/manganese transport system substrate-binding protein